ncbi:MAG: hypothetical protein K2H66_04875, partial [Oscillospiraceae bacterium]|nr:hypothetical protein [Oscillospiraceae bacterium]
MKSIHDIISNIIVFICLIMSIVSIWISEDFLMQNCKILFFVGFLIWLMCVDREYYFFTYETLSKRRYKQCHKLKNKIVILKKMFASELCN